MPPKRKIKPDYSLPLAQLATVNSQLPADARLLERATAAVEKGLDTLLACIETVTQELHNGPYTTALGSHLAYLTQHATSVLDGVRKLEAHDQRAVKAMTPEERDALILSYIADLPEERRAAVVALLQNTQTAKSIL